MSEKNTRTLQGKVISNKMDKSITVAIRASREAPNLWEIHHTYYQTART